MRFQFNQAHTNTDWGVTANLILPITSKLIPRKENLKYLAQTAVLTRFGVGAIRILENRPVKNTKPDISPVEKKKAFWERLFVEMFGTSSYVLALHLGQDIAAKFLEKRPQLTPPQFKNLPKVSPAEHQQINKAITEIFGSSSQGIIKRLVYGEKVMKNGTQFTRRATLDALKEKLGSRLYKQIREPMLPYVQRVKRSGSVALLAGIIASAVTGGVVIQWINDRLFAPVLDQFFGKTPTTPTASKIPPHYPYPPSFHPFQGVPQQQFSSQQFRRQV